MLIDIATRVKNIAFPLRCITAKEAAAEMKDNGGLLIDVREPAEVNACPVARALTFPRGVLEMKVLGSIKDATHPIYIHCASGTRAKLAAEQLLLLGYENVNVITCPVNDIMCAVDG